MTAGDNTLNYFWTLKDSAIYASIFILCLYEVDLQYITVIFFNFSGLRGYQNELWTERSLFKDVIWWRHRQQNWWLGRCVFGWHVLWFGFRGLLQPMAAPAVTERRGYLCGRPWSSAVGQSSIEKESGQPLPVSTSGELSPREQWDVYGHRVEIHRIVHTVKYPR